MHRFLLLKLKRICFKIGVKPCKITAFFPSFSIQYALYGHWTGSGLSSDLQTLILSLLQGESCQQCPCEVRKRHIHKVYLHKHTGPYHLTALLWLLSLTESRACLLHPLWGTWKPGGSRSELHWGEGMSGRTVGYLRGQRSFEMEILTLEKAAVCNVMGPDERELFPWDEEIYYSVFSIPATREGSCTLAARRRPVLHFCSRGAEKAGMMLCCVMG